LAGELRFRFLGAHDGDWRPTSLTGRTVSYMIGRDRSKWVSGAVQSRELQRTALYPGIDMVFYGKSNQLEYDFLVAPHAGVSQIRMQVEGALNVSISRSGDLLIQTRSGVVRQRRPAVFQAGRDGARTP